MKIQAHQIRNVLRTYGHLKPLQKSQSEGKRNQIKTAFPHEKALSEKSLTQETTPQNLLREGDHPMDS